MSRAHAVLAGYRREHRQGEDLHDAPPHRPRPRSRGPRLRNLLAPDASNGGAHHRGAPCSLRSAHLGRPGCRGGVLMRSWRAREMLLSCILSTATGCNVPDYEIAGDAASADSNDIDGGDA